MSLERIDFQKTQETLGISKEDTLLLFVLRGLEKNWYEDGVGIVAAAIFDRNNLIFSTSTKDSKTGLWNHAEKNAISEYLVRFKSLPSGNAILAVTLSPCVRETSTTRLGNACTKLILGAGVSRIHFGAQDVNQPQIETTIEITQTNNETLRRLSETIAGLFAKRPYHRDEIDFSVLNTFNHVS
jgi:pyrimidine deaminase RibD-like protein